MHKVIAVAMVLSHASAVQPTPASLVSRYVDAIGGEQAIRAVRTRVTEGEFENGRNLKTRFRIIEEAPNKRVTIIGTEPIGSTAGSGRGYDGTNGWDKNFIGTGLRTLEGRELADAARDADMLRPLHLLDDCAAATVESHRDADVVKCTNKNGAQISFSFNKKTGLLEGQEIGVRGVTIHYADYRAIDGVRLPFTTRIEVPGATIQYNASSIVHNPSVDPKVFQKPPA